MLGINHVISWYFRKSALPFWCILVIDTLLIFGSLLVVYTLNSGLLFTASNITRVCGALGVYMLFYLIGFRLFHTYSGVLRYSSFIDLQRVGGAILVGLTASLVARHVFDFNNLLWPIRARDLFLGSFLAMMLMWTERVLVKFMYESVFRQAKAESVFIYGIRNGGIAVAKSIRTQDPARYVLKGFVSDTPDLYGKVLMGVRVYKNNSQIADVMSRQGVKVLFVTAHRSDDLRHNADMVNSLIDAGIKIYMVPDEQEWSKSDGISSNQLREVDIEDLLPREKIEVDMEAIGRQLSRRRILITGAAGSIGSEMVRQVSAYGPASLMLIDQAETPLHDVRLMMRREFPDLKTHTVVADIANATNMKRIFEEFKPDYVFHAAAYKHVPMMEDNPWESIRNNVLGTRVIADMAVATGVEKFVMVSTDKAVNPTNVMGCSKRICEIYVQSLDQAIKSGRKEGKTQFVTTRFGNVLGSNGSVIPLFKEQIKKGGPLTVTHPDIIRFFMLIPEACKLVLEAGTMGHGGEIFVFDMGQPVKIVDLARRMIRLSGANVEIRFTGLRDGEKLYEEVLADQEQVLPTFHEKIKIAKVREYDYDSVCLDIERLSSVASRGTAMEVVAMMKQMVPEYKSQHSVYEKLDTVAKS